jgi:hypothetical protein
MDAQTLTQSLGGIWHNGRGQAPCPVCQPERRRDQNALSISENGGNLLLHCFKGGCEFRDIAKAAGAPLKTTQADPNAQREQDQKRQAYEAHQIAKARDLWGRALPIVGTKAEGYLRGRGITCPLPETLRFAPDVYHGPSGRWACAMVAQVSTGGIHRTFFDKSTGDRLKKSAKMMMGPCSGGAVCLSQAQGPLVVAEGIETALSLSCGLLRGPATIWAALSAPGIKALNLPGAPGKLVIASDGDDAGREASDVLARRASSLGWQVSLLPAPEGRDWNDVLMMKGGDA